MIEILRTNDPVRLSYALALLEGAGCRPVLADRFTASMEGSVSAIQQRILVPDAWEAEARRVLEVLDAPPPEGWMEDGEDDADVPSDRKDGP